MSIARQYLTWPPKGSQQGPTPGHSQMPCTSDLHCKNGRYYARIRTPKPLLPRLDQHEIRWSLQTGCLKTARRHLLLANALIHELFEQVYMEIAPLSELEKIRLKTRIEQIKLEKLAEFRTMSAAPNRRLSVRPQSRPL